MTNATPTRPQTFEVPAADAQQNLRKLLALISHLPKEEQKLMVMRFEHGMGPSKIASLQGIRRQDVARSLAKSMLRIKKREFKMMTLYIDQVPHALRRLGRMHFVEGISVRAIVAQTEIKLHEAREQKAVLKALAPYILKKGAA